MKTKFIASTVPLLFVLELQGTLLITGVVDGTQAGGNPKAIEVTSTIDGLVLSDFFILRDTNGSSDGNFTISGNFQFPEVTLNAGDFYYIYGNTESETFLEEAGIGNTDSNAVISSIANHNGDDILAISTSASANDIVDSFGLLGQGDTDFYANSISYRPSNATASPTGVLDAGNFDITPYSDNAFTSTFGTFVVIPEPSTALLGGLAMLTLLRRRR